jgi:release factor glutamine methyltransferase
VSGQVATRDELQAALARRLGSPIEARWLIEGVLGRPGPHQGAVVSEGLRTILWELADRRLASEPLQYVLGTWAFRTLELSVDPRALIPRPETEQVVEVALGELRRLVGERRDPVAVDLGTGTGAIALSIAVELPGAQVWATDADPGALALASANRERIGVSLPAAAERVTLRAGSWFEALPDQLRGRIDLMVSNPPYVSEAEWPTLDLEVRREPYGALVAGPGSDGTPGLADVEAVLRGSVEWLARPGVVVVELASHQAVAAVAAARHVGLREVWVAPDLAGRDRALVGRV